MLSCKKFYITKSFNVTYLKNNYAKEKIINTKESKEYILSIDDINIKYMAIRVLDFHTDCGPDPETLHKSKFWNRENKLIECNHQLN